MAGFFPTSCAAFWPDSTSRPASQRMPAAVFTPMSMPRETTFAVNAYQDPVMIKVVGRACFQNTGPLNDFFRRMIASGRRAFVVDFQECSGMDSTFLGVLAGIGIELRKPHHQGSLVVCRLGERNLELVTNLGLHRILTVDGGQALNGTESVPGQSYQSLAGDRLNQVQNARLVLQAHENLVEVDESNRAKFQDVIAFLRNQG